MSVVSLAEQTVAPVYIEFDPTKWFYGIAVLAVFLIALVVVGLFNLDKFKSSDH